MDKETEAPPELDFCSWCKEHAVFEYDEVEGWVSICCTARAISVDYDLD